MPSPDPPRFIRRTQDGRDECPLCKKLVPVHYPEHEGATGYFEDHECVAEEEGEEE